MSEERLFNRMTAAEYIETSSSRIGSISIPYSDLVKALGEPHKNEQRDFPDDNNKVDVCWGIKSAENENNKVLIWNYKNGPAYTGSGTIEGIDHYSVYYNNNKEFFDKLSKVVGWTTN